MGLAARKRNYKVQAPQNTPRRRNNNRNYHRDDSRLRGGHWNSARRVRASRTVGRSSRNRRRLVDDAYTNQWAPLVDHFNAPTPNIHDRRNGRQSSHSPQLQAQASRVQRKRPSQSASQDTRAQHHHRPFQMRWSAMTLLGSSASLLILLLGIYGSTLTLSQRESNVSEEIRIRQESISNRQKTIASLRISPETAIWAEANGWRQAEQRDFDEIPVPKNKDSLR